MDKFFKIKESGSTVRTEILAGFTTFITMAYILFVNPSTLSAPAAILGNTALAGQIANGVFFATCLAAFIGTILMGLYAKIPFAQAPGMGLNAFFAYTVMLGMGYTYQQALAFVFISGLLFILITVIGLREAVVRAIPQNIKLAISAGIGLFLAFIGLQNAGIIVNNDAVLVSLIDFSKLGQAAPVGATAEQIATLAKANTAIIGAILALVGIVIIAALYKLRVKGSIIIGIAAVTLLGIPFGVTHIPTGFSVDMGAQFKDFMNISFFAPFKGGFSDLFGDKGIFSSIVTIVMLVITFSLVDMFDTIGTLLGTARKANLLDKKGDMPRMKQALLCDAIATTTGAMLGTSTVTTYVESSAGIAEGGRTGLTSVVTSILFVVALILAPIIGIVPAAATAPALIFVGVLMMGSIKEIDFDDVSEALPAFITMAFMPLTYSIANGIAFGLISYTLVKLLTGKIKEIHIITAILALLFIVRFFLMSI